MQKKYRRGRKRYETYKKQNDGRYKSNYINNRKNGWRTV